MSPAPLFKRSPKPSLLCGPIGCSLLPRPSSLLSSTSGLRSLFLSYLHAWQRRGSPSPLTPCAPRFLPALSSVHSLTDHHPRDVTRNPPPPRGLGVRPLSPGTHPSLAQHAPDLAPGSPFLALCRPLPMQPGARGKPCQRPALVSTLSSRRCSDQNRGAPPSPHTGTLLLQCSLP